MNGDAGFGMVELLVALAICAMLAIGAGGLISLGLKLRDRVELTADVQQALLDLRAVSSEFGGGTWVGLGDAADDAFLLCRGGPGSNATQLGLFSLTADSAGYQTEFARSEAGISVFETHALEYLVVTSDGQDWRAAGELANSQPLAVRLRLSLGARTWRMLLWMARSSTTQPIEPGALHCAA